MDWPYIRSASEISGCNMKYHYARLPSINCNAAKMKLSVLWDIQLSELPSSDNACAYSSLSKTVKTHELTRQARIEQR